MLNSEIVADWLDEAETTLTYDENPVVPEGVESLDPEECDELLARLAVKKNAIGFLQEAARARLVEHIGVRGFVRFGERTYRAGPDRKVTVKDDKASEFWEFVESKAAARRLFNPNGVRFGGLRELVEADSYVDPETGEVGWSAFSERFLNVEEGAVKVTEQPRTNKYVPKYVANAPDGEVQYRGDVA